MNTNTRTLSFLLFFSSLGSSLSVLKASAISPPSAPTVQTPALEKGPTPTHLGYEIPGIRNRFQAMGVPVKDTQKTEIHPQVFGGTSFTGLIARLLGEALNRQFEGLNAKQIIYFAVADGKTTGLAHAATSEWAGQLIHTLVYYTPGGTLKKVEVEGLSEKLTKELTNEGSLKQFEGFQTEDFEVVRGRRGRIVSRGTFLSKVKRPRSSEGRAAFEKILRSVRYSSAFMDVAYFITQHPDQADKLTQEFPDGIELSGGIPMTGPEAFVDKKNLASPIDGKPFHPEENSSTSREE